MAKDQSGTKGRGAVGALAWACVAVAASMGASLGAAREASGQVLAFPEAEGFGRFATGARTSLASATLYRVTNLNDSGPGSFRDAVSQSNRFIVFEVGGIVNLQSTLAVARSNLTIAGQTAPGGIVFYGQRMSFTSANNLIARHFAVRKGNAGVRDDTAGLARGTNMIFDHMSFTWGVDETFSMNPDSGFVIDNITVQDSVIAQGLDRLGHSAGGLMTLSEGARFSILRSLFADNVTRNPKVRGENEFINNVVYGWETAAYIMGDTTSMTSRANAIGNYFIEGPVDGGSPFTSGTPQFNIHGADNRVDTNRNGVLDGVAVTSYPGATVSPTRFAFPTTNVMTAAQALPFVLKNVGPTVVRDAVDTRIVSEVQSYGTLGGVILRETDLFPAYGTDPTYLNPRARIPDTDNDGMADDWELSKGLNPASSNDWNGLTTAGYTRLEEYLNELGATGMSVTSGGGTWTTPGTWTGRVPTLADEVLVSGTVSHSAGYAFARRAAVSGAINVAGGSSIVVDTLAVDGMLAITGGTMTTGRLMLGSTGRTGALQLRTGATLQTGTISGNGGAGSFDWDGGTLRTTGAANITVPVSLGANGGTIDTTTLAGVISGRITGTGMLTKLGSGTLTLSASNGFSGGVTLTGGLRLAHSNAAGTGAITVTSSGGTVLLANGVNVRNDLRTRNLFEVLDVPDAGATATYSGNLAPIGSSQIRFNATGAGALLNITGTVSAPNGLYIRTGSIVVGSSASVTGSIGAVGRGLTAATSMVVRDNATFALTGGFSMGGGSTLSSGTITVRDNATLSAGASAFDLLNTTTATCAATLNLDGGTMTAGAIVKTSTGTTQTAVINFNGGTLKYGGSAAAPNFLPALAGTTAFVKLGGLRFDDSGQTVTITEPLLHDPAIPGLDGGLTKLGGGTLVLAGANTFNGPTTVSAGTLMVIGSIASSAVVLPGTGMVGGTGALRSLTAGPASVVAPGNGIGTLTVEGDADIAGTLRMEIDGTGLGANDQLVVRGALDLSGATLQLVVGPGALNDPVYVLARYGSLTGGAGLTVTGVPAGYQLDLAYDTGASGRAVALVAVIPEPATGGCVLGVAVACLSGRRRRRA